MQSHDDCPSGLTVQGGGCVGVSRLRPCPTARQARGLSDRRRERRGTERRMQVPDPVSNAEQSSKPVLIHADCVSENTGLIKDTELDDIEAAIAAYVDPVSNEDGVLAWHMMPNHADSEGKASPEGAFVVFDERAPAFPDAFNHKFFSGVAIAAVLGEIPPYLVDGDAVLPESVRSALIAAAPETRPYDERPRLEGMDPNSTGQNDCSGHVWKPVLGDGGNFVGLYQRSYVSGMPGRLYHRVSYYLVAKSGADLAGEQLYERMVENQERSRIALEAEKKNGTRAPGSGGWRKHTTTLADFVASPEFTYARSLARRNRARLLSDAADALGLRIATTVDRLSALNSARGHPAIARPLVDVVSNTLHNDRTRRHVLFYGACVDTARYPSPAFPVCINPAIGLVVHHAREDAVGDSTSPGAFGPALGLINDVGGAFPMSTGRVLSVAQLVEAGLLRSGISMQRTPEDVLVIEEGAYCDWVDRRVLEEENSPGQNSRRNDKLLGPYRERNAAWKRAERVLGLKEEEHSESALLPCVLKIARTAPHRLPC